MSKDEGQSPARTGAARTELDPELVDEARLETDAAYRFAFVRQYVGLTDEDLALARASRSLMARMVPELLAAVHGRLTGWAATRRHFHDDALVTVHLRGYVESLLLLRGDDAQALWFERVARAHTPEAGDPMVSVPLVQIDALLGFIADQVIVGIDRLELPPDRKIRAIRAFSKLLWVQNDMFQWLRARRA
ncbi:MAG: hypothetical protein IT373_16170 [Polyangiaceae bacterium]|nr:hypothetical protein [Polyangiaceae bacterium]